MNVSPAHTASVTLLCSSVNIGYPSTSKGRDCLHFFIICFLPAESLDTAVDPLDSFMSNLTDQLDKGRKADIKHQLHSLKKVIKGAQFIVRACSSKGEL